MKGQIYLVVLLLFIQITACRNRSQAPLPETKTAGEGSFAPDNNDLLGVLQGKWQSESDSTYVLEIVESKMRHINKGQTSVETEIEVDGACQNVSCAGSDAADGWCFLEKGQFDIQCHLVLKCTSEELKYAALGAANGQLAFKKVR